MTEAQQKIHLYPISNQQVASFSDRGTSKKIATKKTDIKHVHTVSDRLYIYGSK